MPSKGMQMLEMSDIMMDTVPVAEDGEDESQQLVPRTVNHAKFDKLDDQLKVPVGSVPPVKAPKSTSDGELCGAYDHRTLSIACCAVALIMRRHARVGRLADAPGQVPRRVEESLLRS